VPTRGQKVTEKIGAGIHEKQSRKFSASFENRPTTTIEVESLEIAIQTRTGQSVVFSRTGKKTAGVSQLFNLEFVIWDCGFNFTDEIRIKK
jgi:hypothetical protein